MHTFEIWVCAIKNMFHTLQKSLCIALCTIYLKYIARRPSIQLVKHLNSKFSSTLDLDFRINLFFMFLLHCLRGDERSWGSTAHVLIHSACDCFFSCRLMLHCFNTAETIYVLTHSCLRV